MKDVRCLYLYCTGGKHLLEQCPRLKVDLLSPNPDANELRRTIKNLKLKVVYENPDNWITDEQARRWKGI